MTGRAIHGGHGDAKVHRLRYGRGCGGQDLPVDWNHLLRWREVWGGRLLGWRRGDCLPCFGLWTVASPGTHMETEMREPTAHSPFCSFKP